MFENEPEPAKIPPDAALAITSWLSTDSAFTSSFPFALIITSFEINAFVVVSTFDIPIEAPTLAPPNDALLTSISTSFVFLAFTVKFLAAILTPESINADVVLSLLVVEVVVGCLNKVKPLSLLEITEVKFVFASESAIIVSASLFPLELISTELFNPVRRDVSTELFVSEIAESGGADSVYRGGELRILSR